MTTSNILVIAGYEKEAVCEHCGRALKHGVKLADGRIVGAQCLNQSMTQAKVRNGKKYRVGSEYIIKMAKCAQFADPAKWGQYGVTRQGMEFVPV